MTTKLCKNPLMYDTYKIGDKTMHNWETYKIVSKNWVKENKTFELILEKAK